ncbi:hypothetical protein HDE_06051 [Halotydeus destructor]|nr:hypothetical protein HDE_06051 [Halotydeus destructor]
MTILQGCCFMSIKNGSYLSAYYTLVFYLMILTAGTFHIHSVYDDIVLFSFTITLCILSALTILTAILLIIGLRCDNATLLLPWTFVTILTTIMDFIITVHTLTIGNFADPFFFCMVAIDFAISGTNMYCLLCVTTQYLRYRSQPKPANDGDKISLGTKKDSIEDDIPRGAILSPPNDGPLDGQLKVHRSENVTSTDAPSQMTMETNLQSDHSRPDGAMCHDDRKISVDGESELTNVSTVP